MTKIYQVYTNLRLEILEIECSRVTDNFYWAMDNRRNALNTNYMRSFLSKEDAVNYLKVCLKAKINSVKSTLEYYEKELTLYES